MGPPGLPFTRVLRFSADVLVCERMPDAERAACGPDVPYMYPSYPPLAGMHLRVGNVAGPPGGECTVSVAVLGLIPLCCSQKTSSRLS